MEKAFLNPMNTQEIILTLSILFVGLVLSVVVGLTCKNFLNKLFGAAAHVFTEHFATSVEIRAYYGHGSNVTTWLKQLIEDKCEVGHFRATNSIANLKTRSGRLHEMSSNVSNEKKKKDGDDVDDDVYKLKKQLDPLQSGRSIFFFHKRTVVHITRNIDPDCKNHSTPTEVYNITAYGTRNKQFLIEMINEARKMAEKKPKEEINYYKAVHSVHSSSWERSNRFKPRAVSSIILQDGVTNEIEKDVQEFMESKEWYKERGIPYRRGYLLYGPPGCGKTSFVKAIAGQIGYDIYEMPLSNRNLTDESLNSLMSEIDEKSILLFEDVDAVFLPRLQDEERSDKDDGLLGKLKIRETKSKISFSGLLNAIDGVASQEDYIVFMTTNQIEKLDSALIRPGRIDKRQLIDYPDVEQILTFFKKFYPGCDDSVAETFAKAVKKLDCKPSVAQIQGIFLKHKHEPEANLLDVDTLIDVCKDNFDPLRVIYL